MVIVLYCMRVTCIIDTSLVTSLSAFMQNTVCEVCGDIGFKHLLVCCRDCTCSVVHQYVLSFFLIPDVVHLFNLDCAVGRINNKTVPL